MLYWQQNWQLGMGICVVAVMVIYLTTSISILNKCRKMGFDISSSAMIPIANVFILLKCGIKRKIEISKEKKNKSKIFSDDEEIDLWS